MRLTTEGFVLSVKPFGEDQAVVSFFTEQHGKLRGLVRRGKKQISSCQPFAQVHVTHTRRLEHQLGSVTLEPIHPLAASVLECPLRLKTIVALAEMLDHSLPEGHVYDMLYQQTQQFLSDILEPHLWNRLGVFELNLLMSLGYGLSLERETAVPCANNTPLTYVSPRTGRAVSAEVGEPYKEKLLRLPHALGGPVQTAEQDVLDMFILTGHFLKSALPERIFSSRTQLLNYGQMTAFTG